MDTPRCKTQKDTKSWLLGVTVAKVTEAKYVKIAKLTYFEAILHVEGLPTDINYQRHKTALVQLSILISWTKIDGETNTFKMLPWKSFNYFEIYLV